MHKSKIEIEEKNSRTDATKTLIYQNNMPKQVHTVKVIKFNIKSS